MKKLFLSIALVALVFGVAGCEKVEKGNYKEGTYEATVVDDYNNENNIASAKIVIDANGKIESVYLDTTYKGSTKKALKDDYNMKKFNSNAAGEWYEQVEKLEKAIVENQGLDTIKLNSDGTTDAVSGCTIKINALYNAVKDALAKAK